MGGREHTSPPTIVYSQGLKECDQAFNNPKIPTSPFLVGAGGRRKNHSGRGYIEYKGFHTSPSPLSWAETHFNSLCV